MGRSGSGEQAADVRASPGLQPRTTTLMLLALPVLLAVGWLVAGALVRDVPTLTAAFGRTLACVPVLLAVSLVTPSYRGPAVMAARRPVAVLGLATTGFLVYYVGTFAAIRLTGPAVTGLVVSLLPCFTYAVGIVGFGEKLHARRLAGTAIATAAVLAYSLGQPLEPSGAADASVTLRALGLALALAATLSYALYTYLFRARMADLPSPASLPAITAAGALLLAPAGLWQAGDAGVALAGWALAALLGAGLTAPVFLIAHELVLRRGPLATNAAALVVPFLIRVGSWALGWLPAPGAVEVALFAACATGVGLVVTSGQAARRAA